MNNITYKPAAHEKVFKMNPIGIKYTCEFCGTGSMAFDRASQPQFLPTVDGVAPAPMFNHICEQCGKTMLLPKCYPCIQWEEGEEITDQLEKAE